MTEENTITATPDQVKIVQEIADRLFPIIADIVTKMQRNDFSICMNALKIKGIRAGTWMVSIQQVADGDFPISLTPPPPGTIIQ